MKVTIQVNISVNGKEVFEEEVSQAAEGPRVTVTGFGLKDVEVGDTREPEVTACCKLDGSCSVWEEEEDDNPPIIAASNILANLADIEDTVYYKGQYRTIKQIVELIRQERFDKEAAKHLVAEPFIDHISLCEKREIMLKVPVTKKSKSNWVSYQDDIDGACRIPLTYSEATMLEELHSVRTRSTGDIRPKSLAKQLGVAYASLTQIKWQLKNKFKNAGLTVPVLGSFKKGGIRYYLNPLFKV